MCGGVAKCGSPESSLSIPGGCLAVKWRVRSPPAVPCTYRLTWRRIAATLPSRRGGLDLEVRLGRAPGRPVDRQDVLGTRRERDDEVHLGAEERVAGRRRNAPAPPHVAPGPSRD